MASTVNVSVRVVWQIVGKNVRRFALSQKGCNKKVLDRGESSQFCCSDALLAAFKMPKQVAYNARGASQRGLKCNFRQRHNAEDHWRGSFFEGGCPGSQKGWMPWYFEAR